MDHIFIAFANSQDNKLDHLEDEDDIVYRHLNMGKRKFEYGIYRESLASIDKISQALVDYQYEMSIFLFSGHAGLQHLLLENELARAEGIAHSLAQCPNLKLVMLNGCSTMGHVKLLLDKGIPIVIATSAPVNDRKAYMFSNIFFQKLSQGASIQDSFEKAIGNAMIKADLTVHRSLALVDLEPADTPTWGIFCSEENKEMLEYKLPLKKVQTVVGDLAKATPSTKSSPFVKGIPKYKLDILSIARDDQADLFEVQFYNKNSNVQHYFIHSNNLQLPNSFGYRLVFQLETWLKKLNKTIHYVAQNNHFIKIKNWKFSSNIGISQRRIKEYFEELFEMQSIDNLMELDHNFPLIKEYDYVATLFKIHQEEWNSSSAETLKWFINDFCKTNENGSTKFLFFFIIEKHVAYNNPTSIDEEINATLKELEAFNNCTVFPELQPVEKIHLYRWLGNFVARESEINRMVQQVIDTNTDTNPDLMNMSFLEDQVTQIIEKETDIKIM